MRRHAFLIVITALVGSVLAWAGSTQIAGAFSNAADEPVHASFTLEACRLTAGTTLPIAGKFICPDAMYTTGNLGKSWNELDLVPHRLTSSLGTQSDASTTFKVSLAADGVTGGKVGYDVLSEGVVNAAKSDASCTVSSGATTTKGSAASPFGGGTDTVIYRDFTIHQNKGTTCVIDWYQRLALTSHLYPGSSLQSYMFQQADLSGSKKTISIPVNQIEPQKLEKDMTASQTQDYAWNLTKSANPTSLNFANSCMSGDGRTSGNVAITVAWTKVAADPSAITIITHVYATNPSARSIKTSVTDKIYKGSTQANQVTPTESAGSPTHLTNTVVVPAFSTAKVIDFIGTVPAGTAASFNNVATGTYVDEVTNVDIPQTTSAASSATVSVAAGNNGTATIVDTESISAGFHFKLNSVTGTAGSLGSYVLGTSTLGPLVWTSPVVSSSGSVTFNKTITADNASVVTPGDNKALTDTATLVSSGGFTTSASANVELTSGATLTVGVNKTMQGGTTGTQSFTFDVYRSTTKVGTIVINIASPATTGSGSITVPATGNHNVFTVVERPVEHWAPQADQTVTIDLPNCSGSAEFNNTYGPATAKVKKVTVPSGSEAGWTFTLNGPGTPAGGEHVTTSGAGYVNFATALEAGEYTITEAVREGFDYTSKSGDCSFTVRYPVDADHSFACTYTNTQRGSLEVTKSVDWNGVAPEQAQTFEICITGPSYPNGDCKSIDFDGGKLTWDNLLAGDYVVDESDPGSSWVVSGGDGATATVHSGDKTTASSITNTRKLGSLQVTKAVNWNGVTPDHDQTFAICITGPSFPDGDCKTVDYDGGTLTWSNLIPGNYVATEQNPGSKWAVSGSPSGVITVPANGGRAENAPVITNTRKLGSLSVTKSVNWNGVTPDEAQSFEICITGPSYPNGSCKTVGANGGTLSWSNLIPGAYTAAETNPGTSWVVAGSPTGTITVPSDGSAASVVPVITNTRKLGSLQVTKNVNWNGITPDESQTFKICITGPSYPDPTLANGGCQHVDFDGGTLTWSNLIPGNYSAGESNPGSSWIVTASVDGSVVVPANGGQAEVVPVITNTRRLGSLQVTKSVDWNGVTPDESQTFAVCITGPSYPNGNCKTVGALGGTLSWSNLIPGAYVAHETDPGTHWTVAGSPTGTISVPADGGQAANAPVITNTRKLGSLQVTKNVNWNGVTPNSAQTFGLCITGPSFPNGDCKSIDYDGGTATWANLIPGAYTASESDPGSAWVVTGSPSGVITVPADGSMAELVPVITNTRKLGSLSVTKAVDWSGITPNEDQTFEICITGPSYPNGNCKSVGFDGGSLVWSDLIPGAYSAAETDPGNTWAVVGSPSAAIVVPADGGRADNAPTITNTRKLGSLHVTKQVDWNGVTPENGQEFSICIAGPSFDEPDCKTFTSPAGLEQTWSNLIPGSYTITEASLGSEWTRTGDTSATVPDNGGVEEAQLTNTRKLGSLSVTKQVDWNGAEPNEAKEFSICITGPSFPDEPSCKSVDFDGGTVTWTDLIPGDYVATEADPGANWTIDGSPSGTITVPADGSAAEVVAVITNTRKVGSLQVTKNVDWNGTTPNPNAVFSICIKGPSFPNGDCKTIGGNGGVLTWDNLVPGSYDVTEANPGAEWTVLQTATPVNVPADGGKAEASITNLHKPIEVLGEQLARTGRESSAPLALAAIVILAAAGRRIVRRRKAIA